MLMQTLAAAVDQDFPWLTVIMRWVHIVSACLAVGAPFFLRYVVMPAANKTVGPEHAEELRQKVMGRWKFYVHLLIAAFLVTGGYSFWINMPDASWAARDKMLYHSIFGLKMIGALVIFFLASALTGRSAAFEKIRKRHKMWATLVILLGFSVILCGNILRQLHVINEKKPAAATLPASLP